VSLDIVWSGVTVRHCRRPLIVVDWLICRSSVHRAVSEPRLQAMRRHAAAVAMATCTVDAVESIVTGCQWNRCIPLLTETDVLYCVLSSVDLWQMSAVH